MVEPVAAALAPDAALDVGELVAGAPTTLAVIAPAGAAIGWDTDGDGAFDDPATFTPPSPGDYTLRAQVGGAETTIARTVTAGTRRPVAAFASSDDTPEPGEPVTLTASASDPDGGPVSLAWDLDDDGAFDDAAGTSATVTFAAGDHAVGLEARDAGGDVGVRYVTLTVARGGDADADADRDGHGDADRDGHGDRRRATRDGHADGDGDGDRAGDRDGDAHGGPGRDRDPGGDGSTRAHARAARRRPLTARDWRRWRAPRPARRCSLTG